MIFSVIIICDSEIPIYTSFKIDMKYEIFPISFFHDQ